MRKFMQKPPNSTARNQILTRFVITEKEYSFGAGMIEILISLVIIAGGLLALGKLQGNLVTSGSVAKQQSESAFVAQRVIEDLRSKGWTHPSLTAGSYSLDNHNGQSATYGVSYVVTNSAAGGPEFKTVEATVSWTDALGLGQFSKLIARFQKSGADGSIRILNMSSSSGSSASGASSSSSSRSSTLSSSSSTSSSRASSSSYSSGRSSSLSTSSSSSSSPSATGYVGNACTDSSKVATTETCDKVDFVGTTGIPKGASGNPKISFTVTNANTGSSVSGVNCGTSDSHSCFSCDDFTAATGTTYLFTLKTTEAITGVPKNTISTRTTTVSSCTKQIPAN
jgi:Tfp pilus assembly protein PilV